MLGLTLLLFILSFITYPETVKIEVKNCTTDVKEPFSIDEWLPRSKKLQKLPDGSIQSSYDSFHSEGEKVLPFITTKLTTNTSLKNITFRYRCNYNTHVQNHIIDSLYDGEIRNGWIASESSDHILNKFGIYMEGDFSFQMTKNSPQTVLDTKLTDDTRILSTEKDNVIHVATLWYIEADKNITLYCEGIFSSECPPYTKITDFVLKYNVK